MLELFEDKQIAVILSPQTDNIFPPWKPSVPAASYNY